LLENIYVQKDKQGNFKLKFNIYRSLSEFTLSTKERLRIQEKVSKF